MFRSSRVQPLIRFLRGQVGRPWNDVDSEMVAGFREAPWIGAYIAHLVKVQMVVGSDGWILTTDGCWICNAKVSLYVDPVTSKLKDGKRYV